MWKICKGVTILFIVALLIDVNNALPNTVHKIDAGTRIMAFLIALLWIWLEPSPKK